MDPGDITIMLDYNVWARERLLTAVERLSADQYTRAMGNSFSSVRDTMVHIYGAEWIWTARWEGTLPTGFPEAASYPDVASLRTAWSALDAKVRGLTYQLDAAAVNRVIEYTTIAGVPMRSPLWQIIHHVTNHATYHRGQVTTMIRQLGATPPVSMDLIGFYRELAG